MHTVNEIRTYISEGKLKVAISHLWQNFREGAFRDDATLIKGRLETLQDKVIAGVMSGTETTLEENRISYSLLSLLNKIQESETEASLKDVDRQLDNKALIEKLLDILEETFEGFQAQAKIRNRLYQGLRNRLSVDEHLEYEDFFNKYFSRMNDEELASHRSIREFTERILNKYNRKALELILGNEELKESVPKLHELERHLLVWIGKFETAFKEQPAISLVYVGVKEKVPFPSGVERELREYLKVIR